MRSFFFVVVSADILYILLTIFACRAEKGKMEENQVCLKDVLEVLPVESLNKIVPATRTLFLLSSTSKAMRAVVKNVDAVVNAKIGGSVFRNGAGLLDKLNGLNVWCKVIALCLKNCELGEGEGQAIASALSVNTTLTKLDLGDNQLGEDGEQAIASALSVNTTLTELHL
jgi:hypothetical protein